MQKKTRKLQELNIKNYTCSVYQGIEQAQLDLTSNIPQKYYLIQKWSKMTQKYHFNVHQSSVTLCYKQAFSH